MIDHFHRDPARLRLVERRDVSLFSVAQASASISAFSVVLSAL